MEKGERFIFYGKSGVVKGTVASSFEKVTYDIKHEVKVITPYIVSTNGEAYNEKMCLKIKSDISRPWLRRIVNIFTK
jgi:hypothetical protein